MPPGAPFLPLTGGTLGGPLLLAADPAVALGAATKQYVDARAPVVVVPPGGSIEAAHDALPSTGGSIQLAANTTYVVTAAVTFSKPNVHLFAPSWATIIQRGPALGGIMLLLTGAGSLVENLTFDGNGTVNTTGQAEVQLGGPNERITNVQVINSAAQINIAASARGCRVDHCTVTGMAISLSTERGYGVWAANNVAVTVDHNTITGTGIDGIGVNGAGTIVDANMVSGCHCWTPSKGGQIMAYANAADPSHLVISNNTVGQGGASTSGGIESTGNNVTITGNTVSRCYGRAISLGESSTDHGFTVTGNTVINCGQDLSGGVDAIYVWPGVCDFVICGNRVTDDQATPTTRWPVCVDAGASDRYAIVGNELCVVATPNSIAINDAGTGVHKTIRDNAGADTTILPVASAATLSLSLPNKLFQLTGTTTVTAIAAQGAAVGRQVTLIPNGVVTFQAGNNIANTLTTAPNVPVVATCDGTNWYFSGVSSSAIFTTLSVSGAAALSGGINFGSQLAPGGTNSADLSKHLALYSTSWGLNVASPGQMQVVASGNLMMSFTGAAIVNLIAATVANGTFRVNGNVGFNNTAPVAKPTVTGAKGGNAALASLLTALASYGLVTDSTTA